MSVEEDSDDMLVDFDRLPPTVRETIIQEAPDIAERGNVPLAMLRDPGDIFEIPQLPLTTVNFRIVGIYFGSVPGQPPTRTRRAMFRLSYSTTIQTSKMSLTRSSRRQIRGTSMASVDSDTTHGGEVGRYSIGLRLTTPNHRSRREATRTVPTSYNSISIRIHSGSSSTTSTTWSPGAGRQTQLDGKTPTTILSHLIDSQKIASTTAIMSSGDSSPSGPSRRGYWRLQRTT